MNIFRCSCDIRSLDAMLLVAFGYSLMLVACCGELVAATLFCIVTLPLPCSWAE